MDTYSFVNQHNGILDMARRNRGRGFARTKIEFPAHQDNLLYRLIFPRSKEQREDQIRWTIDGLLETVHQEDEALYKACGEDGSPVGLIGWTTSPGAFAKGVKRRDHIDSGQVVRSGAKQGPKPKNRNSFNALSLDVTSWLVISKRLKEERQRVLRGRQGNAICRITFMAVDPNHQCQGVGSMLMQSFCGYVDENALDAFVLSSPAGNPLYSKFGFKAVGVVKTKQGNFTSMLRTSGLT
ncbi:NAT_SF acetyltransferase domain-containing protein [Histoplasma ohiense]|nr:NAT_SF acetyltransferase domain-containing protein [Histoplasma ohiense (nom. inval.)]